MSNPNNFGYLGELFQIQLLNNIITDTEFTTSIIDVVKPEYFNNKYFSLILTIIKEYHEKYDSFPDFPTIKQLINSEVNSEQIKKILTDTLIDVKKVKLDNKIFVQEKSLKFCKQQELKKAMSDAQKIIKNGDFENYDTIEGMLSKALQIGVTDKGTSDVFFNINTVLDDDYRHPIPTTINGLDKYLKGGLAKGEIGVILAPTGVGKTTILSKLANGAFNLGYNVLQIFFEDNPKIIQRKHFTMWTGISPDELNNNRSTVLSKINEIKETSSNRLILKKLPSDTLNMNQIKTQVRKLIAEGNNIDLIVLDYIDCVRPNHGGSSDYSSEGGIMRAFESMCAELNIGGWTAVQGNRSSISSEVVTTDQMGGSIKKAQVGHVIITVAKSLEQKENNLATIAITKSRIGKDGLVFQNCKFDNEMLDIDIDEKTDILLGDTSIKDDSVTERERLRELFNKKNNLEDLNN